MVKPLPVKRRKKTKNPCMVRVTNGTKGEYEADLNVDGKYEDVRELIADFQKADIETKFEIEYTLGRSREMIEKRDIRFLPSSRLRKTPQPAQEIQDDRVRDEVCEKPGKSRVGSDKV